MEKDPTKSRHLPSLEFASHDFKASGRRDIFGNAMMRNLPEDYLNRVPDAIRPFLHEVTESRNLGREDKTPTRNKRKWPSSSWEKR